jgi:hypothetical protein
MSDEWTGVVKAVAPKYLKGAEDLTIRRRLVLAMLEKRGSIVTNYMGSHETNFDVDWKEPPVESTADGATVTYERRDYLKQATIDWRGYVATDLVTKKEQAMSKGDTVLVDRYNRIIPKLTKSVRNKIGLEFYIDGGAAGNENRFCGTKTFTAEGTVAAGDIIAQPDDSYFGLDTDVNQGGRWSSDLSAGSGQPNATIANDWPEGEGSSEFDFWSPKLVNWSSTAWGTSSAAWEDNCERVMRRTLQWMTLTAGADGYTMLFCLAGALHTGFKDKMSARMRVLTPHREAEDLGFPDVLNFEGAGIHTEFGIPANYGYCMNMDEIQLCILENSLINSEGPDYDPNSLSYKFAVYTFGNFKFLPKHVAELKDRA